MLTCSKFLNCQIDEREGINIMVTNKQLLIVDVLIWQFLF